MANTQITTVTPRCRVCEILLPLTSAGDLCPGCAEIYHRVPQTQVTLLTVEANGRGYTWACRDREVALGVLTGWVRQRWNEEEHGTQPPDDAAAVDAYFGEIDFSAVYEIHALPVVESPDRAGVG